METQYGVPFFFFRNFERRMKCPTSSRRVQSQKLAVQLSAQPAAQTKKNTRAVSIKNCGIVAPTFIHETSQQNKNALQQCKKNLVNVLATKARPPSSMKKKTTALQFFRVSTVTVQAPLSFQKSLHPFGWQNSSNIIALQFNVQ